MDKKDLVLEMLDEGALVNNTYEKDPKIMAFFEKFHKNIINIEDNVKNEVDKRSLRLLANAMIAEFNIKV